MALHELDERYVDPDDGDQEERETALAACGKVAIRADFAFGDAAQQEMRRLPSSPPTTGVDRGLL